ncbi:radical SAM protein [Anaerobacterium chartisolvens]|nr:radical SAM protein [Anaerobacterium chartisolvens]
MVFNADNGITAAISSNELYSLKAYLETGLQNEFISRLIDLELAPTDISGYEMQSLLKEIEKTENVSAPLRSFAAPESIHIDLTTVCPLKCPHCYKDTSQDTEMSFEVFSSIIDQAKALGVFQIALGGGEPLLVKNLPTFVKKVTSCGMACTITTSGYGLTVELLEDLKVSGVNHIQVSLNGSTKEINSNSRDGFDKAISALDILAGSNVLFGINWVARMDNVHDFENVVTYAKRLKADNINILRYKPSMREDYGKYVLTNEAFNFLVAVIRKISGIKIKIDSAFSNILCHLYGNQINTINCGCGAGRRFMMIDPSGRFKPCSHMSLVSEEQDIMEYWINSPDLEKLRKGEECIYGNCKSCSCLNVCRGCRAICERIHNDINAGENNCPVFIKKEMV